MELSVGWDSEIVQIDNSNKSIIVVKWTLKWCIQRWKDSKIYVFGTLKTNVKNTDSKHVS